MLKITLSLLLVFVSVSIVHANDSDDTKAIKETALNYMEGWYQGDLKRMKASLYKKLAKRSLQVSMSGKGTLRHTSASDMIAFTSLGYGKSLWRKDLTIDVIVLDQTENIASVKVVTPHYYEYLHLAKTSRGWIIINTLYEK